MTLLCQESWYLLHVVPVWILEIESMHGHQLILFYFYELISIAGPLPVFSHVLLYLKPFLVFMGHFLPCGPESLHQAVVEPTNKVEQRVEVLYLLAPL